jgi:hypothetical protein
MKLSSALLIILFLINIPIHSQTPTNAGPPDSSHVLVVWNGNSSISDSVKNYYVNARGIPESNIIRLDNLTDEWFTYDGTSHWIEIVQSGDILKDTTQAWEDSPYVTNGGAGATFHSWQYFYERIADPIKQYLETKIVNGIPLKETIRYIVLCKGVPYKLQSRHDWSGTGGLPPNNNISLQSLLSILNNEPYYDNLVSLFNVGTPNYTNPYYEAAKESFWYLEYRFLPDFYSNSAGTKLSYLVTRLDGLSIEDTQQMIDNSVSADTSAQNVNNEMTRHPIS